MLVLVIKTSMLKKLQLKLAVTEPIFKSIAAIKYHVLKYLSDTVTKTLSDTVTKTTVIRIVQVNRFFL